MKTGERVVSVLVLLTGIGLLLFVFVAAYQMLTNPIPGLSHALAQHSSPGNAGAAVSANPVADASGAIVTFVLHLAALFAMTLAASLIAARGVQLYHSASHPSAVIPAASSPNV